MTNVARVVAIDPAGSIASPDGRTFVARATVDVVVTGTETASAGPGSWSAIPDPTLACYVRVVTQMSAVCGRARTIATSADASAVLDPGAESEIGKLDRELLSGHLR